MLPEGNMTRNPKTSRNRIPRSVSFVFNSIPKKTRQSRTRFQFRTFMGLEKDKRGTNKHNFPVGRYTNQSIGPELTETYICQLIVTNRKWNEVLGNSKDRCARSKPFSLLEQDRFASQSQEFHGELRTLILNALGGAPCACVVRWRVASFVHGSSLIEEEE